MQDYEKLADLIGDIHEAAAEPELWSDVVGKISDFLGAQACGLVSKNTVSKFAISPYTWGVDPHYLQLYEETYSKFDPLVNLPRFGQVASIPDVVPYDEYRRGPFYQEYLTPQGWADGAMTVLEKSGPDLSIVLFAIPSKKTGMVDDELRRRLAFIAPHARRALLVGNAIDLQQSKLVALTETLNALGDGTFLVDADGRIVHANAVGQAMLYADDLVRSADGRLAARNSWVDQTLREVFAACTNGEMSIGVNGLTLPLTARDGERYVVHVLPLTSSVRHNASRAYGAIAAVYVRKAQPHSLLKSLH